VADELYEWRMRGALRGPRCRFRTWAGRILPDRASDDQLDQLFAQLMC